MNNIEFECKSSTDKKTITTTLIVFIMFFLVVGVGFMSYVSTKNSGILIIPCSFLAIYIAAFIGGLYRIPTSYQILNSNLLIKTRLSVISFNIQDIRSAKVFGSDDQRGMVRTFGAEGVLGCYGKYSSIVHKTFKVYASRSTNWVLLSLKDKKKIVISPDDLKLIDLINDRSCMPEMKIY